MKIKSNEFIKNISDANGATTMLILGKSQCKNAYLNVVCLSNLSTTRTYCGAGCHYIVNQQGHAYP